MATSGSAGRPGGTSAATRLGASAQGAGPRCSPGCGAEATSQSGGTFHAACPARGQSGFSQRFQRWRDGESRAGTFVCPAVVLRSADVSAGTKLRVSDEGEKVSSRRRMRRRRRSEVGQREEEQVARSDSENEEPLGWRVRNKSAFVRNVSGASQRSRSCTDQEEQKRGKLKGSPLSAARGEVGMDHSAAAGILLSTENRRSASAPVTGPDRLLAWCAAMTSAATPLGLPRPQAERSVSPDSNDSISEELNHFKPIVCSPCTPPKRLPDGRVLEPTIVKSTPRNLSRGLHKATSYEASPAVLQKWRQIELDRQNLKVDCKATLTSPVLEVREDHSAKTAARGRNSLAASNKRKLDFESEEEVTGHLVKIRVPAVRYGQRVVGESADMEAAGGPALFAGETLFGRSSGFRLCRLQAKEAARKDPDLRLRSSSGRSRKSRQKTRHLDPHQDLEHLDQRLVLRRIQQERRDRSLALQLQRQFDQEERKSVRRPRDSYFLRSWKSNAGRRRGPVHDKS
ncbi:E3 ubiquitin-protein ligase RNF169 [Synchiropus splendidus]|uniref:E3 ubiquitin-protein ligase RNF169 n=1 Tax=Synchiropus splendidus TaxID=270530 RepID=UPI00237D5C2A|nr:E3 ubiquitin-protein ligase RNF169 [Synchiropus splendidus]XP_053736425.1 E3 ubiquitin-protein ligase RNF169 [Synchiropus splendidus]